MEAARPVTVAEAAVTGRGAAPSRWTVYDVAPGTAVQDSRTELDEAAEAVRPVGAAGGRGWPGPPGSGPTRVTSSVTWAGWPYQPWVWTVTEVVDGPVRKVVVSCLKAPGLCVQADTSVVPVPLAPR